MAQKVDAYVGDGGKLYSTETEAEKSLKWGPYFEICEAIDADIRPHHEFGACAYSFSQVLARYPALIKRWLKAYEDLDGKVD